MPVTEGSEAKTLIDLRFAKGERTNVFEKEQQTPNAIILFLYHAPMEDNLRNALTVDMLEQLMSMHYTESIREDEGGAYSVGVSGNLQNYPEEIAQIEIMLPTSPDKRERMTELVYEGVNTLLTEGVNAENLQKVKEYMHRKHAEDLKKNNFWMNAMIRLFRSGKDVVTDYDKLVDDITAADIQAAAKTIFQSGNRIEVGMTSPQQ